MDPFLDTYFFQWHLNNKGEALAPNDIGYLPRKKYADIGALAAWAFAGNGGTGIKVAVIDADFVLHNDFNANIENDSVRFDNDNKPVPGGKSGLLSLTINPVPDGDLDFQNGEYLHPTDTRFSHGTAVAGLICSIKNSAGGRGVAYNSKVLAIQVPHRLDLLFQDKFVVEAIEYAISQNAHIINMSFGADYERFIEKDLLKKLEKATIFGRSGKGIFMAYAVSNDFISIGNEKLTGLKQLIKIGISTSNDQLDGSAFGVNLDFVSPGNELVVENKNTTIFPISTIGGKTAPNQISREYFSGMAGTSFSSPIVAGIAALMLEINPHLTWVELRKILQKTAHKIDIENRTNVFQWKDKNENQIVDSDGKLIAQIGNAVLTSNLINPASDIIRDTVLDVNNITDFSLGQAILVGAQTKIVSTITDQFSFEVEDASSFKAGHRISIGTKTASTSFLTYFDEGFFKRFFDKFRRRPFETPIDRIRLTSNSGFLTGQKVELRGKTNDTDNNDEYTIENIENLTIKSVDSDGLTVQFTNSRAKDYQNESVLRVLGMEDNLLVSAVNGNIITLDPSTPIADISAHPVGTRVEIDGSEIVFIKNIDVGNNKLTVNKLQKDISLPPNPATVPVKGGRIPFRTDYHGFGRVDAFEAVREAKRLFDNASLANPIFDWDLIIRDDLNDTGLNTTNGAINSPDIGVGHDSTIPVINYTVAEPSQNPIANKDRYIFIRIKNIGTKYCLDAELRVFIKTSNGTPNFDFPSAWEAPNDIKEIQNNSNPGLYIFNKDIVEIKENDINPGGNKTYRIKWPKKYIPPRDSNLSTYIMAMITPFDGIRSASQVSDNNNLTYKEVQIVDLILFKDSPSGILLDKEIPLSTYASPVNKSFAIEINSPVQFNVDDIEVIVKRKNNNTPTDKVVFKRIGGTWKFEDNATPDWIQFDNYNTSNPSGAILNTTLTGNFKVGPQQKYIEVKIKIDGVADPLPFEDKHRMKVKVTDLKEGTGLTNDKGARIHFFTITDSNVINNQPSSDAFGPFTKSLEPTKDFFRLTSKHTASGIAKAYAVCNGIVAVQQDSNNNNLVNLILKPLQQPALNFVPIRYFVYKGIKKSSLFDGSNITAKATNRLTESLWQSAENRFKSVTKKNAALSPPLPAPLQKDFIPPPDKTLALHLTTTKDSVLYGDDKPIDNVFFKGDPDFQLPIVYGGWDIGEFEGTGFGFEIILENIAYNPTLDKVRKHENVIEINKLTGSEPNDVKFENRLNREEIINYMDPCAFYGSMYGNRVFIMPGGSASLVSTSDFDKKKGNVIYKSILKNRFANLNRTYIDIRNEHNFSLNFYENYGNNIALAFGKNNSLLEKSYYVSGWPILIVENNDFPIDNNTPEKTIELSLPTLLDLSSQIPENVLPLTYLSQGYPSGSFLKNVRGKLRFKLLSIDDNNGTIISKYTKERISLSVPNNSDEPAMSLVSSYIRIKYLKRLEQSPSSEPISSGIVLRGSHYLDNLLVPVGMQIPFSNTAKIKSVVYDDEVYLDGSFVQSVELDGIAKIGLAADNNGNITLFTFITDLHRKNGEIRNTFAISGEIRNEDGDYLTQIISPNSHLTLSKAVLNINNTAVPYILLDESTAGFGTYEKTDPREYFGFLITVNEFNTILSLAQNSNNFSNKLPVYIAFVKVAGDIHPHGITDTGKSFTRYEMILRGHKKSGTAYQVVQVNTNIIVYSNGNL